jgi:hypothetical protein
MGFLMIVISFSPSSLYSLLLSASSPSCRRSYFFPGSLSVCLGVGVVLVESVRQSSLVGSVWFAPFFCFFFAERKLNYSLNLSES